MLYFLILLIPFVGFMIYLVRQNNRLSKIYYTLVSRLEALAHQLNLENLLDQEALNGETIITNNSIKELEKALHAIEIELEMKKSPTVANRFAHRIQKLQALGGYIGKLEKVAKEKNLVH